MVNAPLTVGVVYIVHVYPCDELLSCWVGAAVTHKVIASEPGGLNKCSTFGSTKAEFSMKLPIKRTSFLVKIPQPNGKNFQTSSG